jgi:hypothetical protein
VEARNVSRQQAVTRFATAVAFLLFAVSQANANLITNGSFELGSFVNQGNETMVLGVGSTVISDWTVVADQLAWIDVGNPWGLSAQDGDRFLDLTAYPTGAPFGGISQTLATVPGQQYQLSFYLGTYTQRWGGPPVSVVASAGSASQTFTVSTPSTSSTWTPFSMLFSANASSTAITLTGSAGFQYIGIDNVSVDAAGVNPIPEPGSCALVLAGLAMLAGGIRRLKA